MDEAGADPNTVPRTVAPAPPHLPHDQMSQPTKVGLVVIAAVAGLIVVLTVVGWFVTGRVGPGGLGIAAGFGFMIIGSYRARGVTAGRFGIQRSLRRQLRGADAIRDADLPVLRQINDRDTLAARATPWTILGMAAFSAHVWLSSSMIGSDPERVVIGAVLRVVVVAALVASIPLFGYDLWRVRRGRQVLAEHDRAPAG